jgi:hypothetical protein
MIKNKGNNTCKCKDMGVENTRKKCLKNSAKHENE